MLLLFSVLSAACVTANLNLVPDARLHLWLVDNWSFYNLPLIAFIVAITFVAPAAWCVRAFLMTNTATAAAMSGMSGLCSLAYHAAWHKPARQTIGVGWNHWNQANAGYIFGKMQGPTRRHWRASQRSQLDAPRPLPAVPL